MIMTFSNDEARADRLARFRANPKRVRVSVRCMSGLTWQATVSPRDDDGSVHSDGFALRVTVHDSSPERAVMIAQDR